MEEDRRLAICSRLVQQQILRCHSSRWTKKVLPVRSKKSSSSSSSLSLSSQNTSTSEISPISFSSSPIAVEREDGSSFQEKSVSVDNFQEKEEEIEEDEEEEEEEEEELRDYERVERN
ncbi:hypothetical protein CSUI_010206, partial [Cystoisospora suis]